MKKSILLLLMGGLLINSAQAQVGDYVVQVAAFDEQVSMDYFQGIQDIFHTKDHNDIHKYYIDGFKDHRSANLKASKIKTMGFNPVIINLSKVNQMCANACGAPPKDDLKLKSIFFDFDRADLRTESTRQLDKLYLILMNNPDYRTILTAHTDSKGSNSYNDALSIRRVQRAKNYLIRKGVDMDRLILDTFGEEFPIALNQTLNGADSPLGRQYNRRVELTVLQNNGNIEPVVEAIRVPSKLQNEMFARKN